MELIGPHALVTGSASGIGSGIAKALSDAGAKVIVADINATGGTAVASSLPGARFCSLDVTNRDSVDRAASDIRESIGALDILVNCAGGSLPTPFFETDEKQWYELIELNLIGAMRCSHAFAPAMAARGAGRIINISSGAGLHGQIGQAAYAAAKGGVNAFTKVLAKELGRSNVTVNAVCPGATETPPMREFTRTEEGQRYVAEIVARIPMGRLGRPEDIAGVVAFLASKAGGYVTGELISVAGGSAM